MKSFKYLLYKEAGGHNWQPVKSDFNFTSDKGVPYVVYKCSKCGITAQSFNNSSTYQIGYQYPGQYVFECPEIMGQFDTLPELEKEETVAVLGGGEGSPKITRKKKKKKGKKKKKSKNNYILAYSELYGGIKSKSKKIVRTKKSKKVKIIRRKKS